MKKQMIFVGKGARVLSEKEMKHVLGGAVEIIHDSLYQDLPDLAACSNKKCKSNYDCGGFCASMTCNGRKEKHCM